ncbi:hypothetical protein GRF29_69g2081887 [Pseudopithomyces chartarum]|uniref:Uncharacterized protein n=1 Tax=Pseudopithomyces chartarum TaxID=1892770 RepID=A0AAN6RIQ3_9PLEO|nr:hypothetical protein GRF29_69g2081887 [Pseudopithomyces chartarum]
MHSPTSSPLTPLRLQPPIPHLLTFMFTTPPTPNAGTILPILAPQLIPQSLTTLPILPSLPHIFTPSLLYKSNPIKCNGVLTICTAAGANTCAALLALTYRWTPSPSDVAR